MFAKVFTLVLFSFYIPCYLTLINEKHEVYYTKRRFCAIIKQNLHTFKYECADLIPLGEIVFNLNP